MQLLLKRTTAHILFVAILSVATTPIAKGECIVQHFPADKPAENAKTTWRVDWGIARHGGKSVILYIKEASFKRSQNEPWLKILGDSRLAEIFVPYNDGKVVYDITGFSFPLSQLTGDDLGPTCISVPQIYRGLVAQELHDERTLWMDQSGRSRRAQSMHLWAVLKAQNYRYIMLYTFRDDGRVGFWLGSTAKNNRSYRDDRATHLHVGCWRINVELGNKIGNEIQHVRYISNDWVGNPRTVVARFNDGKEGAIVWKPEEFTSIRIVSKTEVNDHRPPNKISYVLQPIRFGSCRHFLASTEFTHYDFWVTRADTNESLFNELPKYVSDKESLDNQPVVIWYKSAAIHRPRDEDFERNGYENSVAITAWTGFELKPRDFFASTPLYP